MGSAGGNAPVGDRPDPGGGPRPVARPRDRGRAPRARARSGRRDGLREGAYLRRARAAVTRAGHRERGRDRRPARRRAPAARARARVRPRDRQRRGRARRRRGRGGRPRRLAGCRYHGAAMIHPRIDELLKNVDSRYALVIVAAKRARQINNYHHMLGEGTFDEAPPPLVESRSKNYLTMSLEEIAEGKLRYEYRR